MEGQGHGGKTDTVSNGAYPGHLHDQLFTLSSIVYFMLFQVSYRVSPI